MRYKAKPPHPAPSYMQRGEREALELLGRPNLRGRVVGARNGKQHEDCTSAKRITSPQDDRKRRG